MKHDILEKLAETMYIFKAYPKDDDFSSVAKALISKHPCLTEPGPHRWYGWKNSLTFKMANYRTKLRKAGCEDVAINGGKRSKGNPEGESSSKNIKWPKRGEANYLPNLPEGHDETSLENTRKVLVEEMKKKQPSGTLISQMMDPLRRQEIVKKEPAVQNMIERWPALFTERQVNYFCSQPIKECLSKRNSRCVARNPNTLVGMLTLLPSLHPYPPLSLLFRCLLSSTKSQVRILRETSLRLWTSIPHVSLNFSKQKRELLARSSVS